MALESIGDRDSAIVGPSREPTSTGAVEGEDRFAIDREGIWARQSLADSVEVRLVRTEDTLAQAVEVRRQSYGRHTPEMLPILERPERLDFAPEAVVFVARSGADGRVLGSMRVLTNLSAPLEFEREISLPDRFHGLPISLVQRLSLVSGAAAVEAKKSLFKAYYLYSLAMQIEWMFLYTPPPRDRLFARLGFAQVLSGDGLVAGDFSDGKQVRLLALRVWDVERLWRESNPEWHDFFFRQYTPGIKIFSSVSNWTKSRRAENPPLPLSSQGIVGLPSAKKM